MKVFCLFVALLSVAFAAEEQCASACAPQPITIQLSCNGGGSQHPPPQLPPAHPEPDHPVEMPGDMDWTAPTPGDEHPPAEMPGEWDWTPTPGDEPPPADMPGDSDWTAPAPGGEDHLLPPEHPIIPPGDMPPADQIGAIPSDLCQFNENGYPSHPELFPAGYQMIFYESDNYIYAHADVPFLQPPGHWNGQMDHLGYTMPEFLSPDWSVLACWPIPVLTYPHDGYLDYGLTSPMEAHPPAGK